MPKENSNPVFKQTIEAGGTGAQGMTVTQNVGISPSDLNGLVAELTTLARHLGSAGQFSSDVATLRDTEATPHTRRAAWERIKSALAGAGTGVTAASIVAAGDHIVHAIK